VKLSILMLAYNERPTLASAIKDVPNVNLLRERFARGRT